MKRKSETSCCVATKTIRLHTLLPILVVLALLTAGAPADIPDVTWEGPEVVDTGVMDVSSPSGVSIVYADDLWHVVYEKSGNIYHRGRSSEGWLPVEPLTDGQGAVANPHIARYGSGEPLSLCVVWEDNRTGHSEVWSRRWDGVQWSPEECLTCDDIESRAPVIAAEEGIDLALVAWVENVGGGAILGRFLDHGVWGDVQEISQSPSSAMHPTAGISHPRLQRFYVAWADFRHGQSEIYLRTSDAFSDVWQDEERLTDLAGSCRHPSLHVEACCGDVVEPRALVLFEHDEGVPEIYGVCRQEFRGLLMEQITPDDGIPSTRPSVGGFAFDEVWCTFWGGPGSHYFVSWTDESTPESSSHHIRYLKGCFVDYGSEILSEIGESTSAVGAVEGVPDAGLMAIWIEDVEGIPSLMSQRGSTIGCYHVELLEQPAPSVLLAPEGMPFNTYLFGDICSGGPESGVPVNLRFEDELDGALTWDPSQDHPNLFDMTDSDGEAVFSIRGGGCSQAGDVRLLCSGFPMWVWGGAKSPDVNGDCMVTDTDLNYVQSMMGTDDFCADLNGSGVVDFEDVLIVTSTLGDHCSHLTSGAEIPWEVADGTWLRLSPNPCRGTTRVRLNVPRPGPAHIRIVDAAGRLVRDLGRRRLPAGVTDLQWDSRGEGGRLVASGIYFVSVSVEEGMLRRPVLVLR